jgi:dTMP kinase
LRRGGLLVLEGIDGSGTTTQTALLADALRQRGYDVLVTREPTERAIGSQIRAALQHRLQLSSGEIASLPASSLALLFAADRLDHLAHVVEPALARGAVVISDRYVLSSLAYQSATDPTGEDALEWLRAINSRARRADLTVVLDLPAQVAEERRRQRGGEPELFERSALQERLASLYAQAERLLPGERVVCLRGDRSAEEVLQELLQVVLGWLESDAPAR